MRRLAFSILSVVVIAAGLAPSRPVVAEEQPPARVGRVSVVAGQLGFHAKGETKWSAAAVNYPVATGGAFWTDPKSRAEIRIGAQSIGLGYNTEIDIVRLDQQVLQIAVPQGRIGLHLRQLEEGDSAEVDIPRGGIWLLQPGIYDIDAGTPERPARIMVFEGSARFVGGAVDQGIKAGEAAVISGTDTLTATIERAAPDAFVQWCRARDYREQRLAAPHYVSPGMTGYEELDAYGTWRAVPEYGEVWYPRSVPVGWAPYRHGHWTWLDPWGWNWVDAAPWGFAPSHYGRWAFLSGGWGWIPGAYIASPVYAPALVTFLADPGAIVRGRGAGRYVGWLPLGPGEAYRPGFTNDPGFIRAVNAGVVTNAAGLGTAPAGNAATAFANRRAVTVVNQRTFASAAPVGRAALRVSAAAARDAQVAAQAPARAGAAAAMAASAGTATPGGGTTGTSKAQGNGGERSAVSAAAGGASGAMAARGTGRGGAHLAGPRHRSAAALSARASAHGRRGGSALAGGRVRGGGHLGAPKARASRPGGAHVAHAGRPHRGAVAARHGAPKAAFHGGGGARVSRGGGGPHFSGGGAPHGGGEARYSRDGGRHGGGGGGPHFSGGGAPRGGGGNAPGGGGGGGGHAGGGKGTHGGGKGRG